MSIILRMSSLISPCMLRECFDMAGAEDVKVSCEGTKARQVRDAVFSFSSIQRPDLTPYSTPSILHSVLESSLLLSYTAHWRPTHGGLEARLAADVASGCQARRWARFPLTQWFADKRSPCRCACKSLQIRNTASVEKWFPSVKQVLTVDENELSRPRSERKTGFPPSHSFVKDRTQRACSHKHDWFRTIGLAR